MRIPLVDMPHVLRDCLPKIVTLGVQLLVDLEVCVCVCACFHVYAALYSTRERFYLRLGVSWAHSSGKEGRMRPLGLSPPLFHGVPNCLEVEIGV